MTEEQKKTLRLAIASLVCGCFFIIPFLGFLLGGIAIILGIIALVILSKNKNTLKGQGLAITGIVLGAIATIVIPVAFAIIAALVIPPRLQNNIQAARIEVAKVDVTSNISTALKLYELDNGKFPSTTQGLDALIDEPGFAVSWNGPYMRNLPVDPWGAPYSYISPGVHNRRSYDLSSYGPDGVKSEDDVTNW